MLKTFFDGLSVLFAQFWPRKCLFTKNWEKAQNRPSEANFLRSWPWAQHLKKWLKTVDFGVKSQFVVKRHVLGQNGLIKTIRPLKKCFEHFLCLFWDPFQMAIFWLATPCEGQNGDFLKAPARPQGLLSGSKLIWELFRARESPHKNFSSNAHLTKVLEHPQNGQFAKKHKIGPNRLFAVLAKKGTFADQNISKVV